MEWENGTNDIPFFGKYLLSEIEKKKKTFNKSINKMSNQHCKVNPKSFFFPENIRRIWCEIEFRKKSHGLAVKYKVIIFAFMLTRQIEIDQIQVIATNYIRKMWEQISHKTGGSGWLSEFSMKKRKPVIICRP